eukprot:2703467-Prymnesium_polylepis.1
MTCRRSTRRLHPEPGVRVARSAWAERVPSCRRRTASGQRRLCLWEGVPFVVARRSDGRYTISAASRHRHF